MDALLYIIGVKEIDEASLRRQSNEDTNEMRMDDAFRGKVERLRHASRWRPSDLAIAIRR